MNYVLSEAVVIRGNPTGTTQFLWCHIILLTVCQGGKCFSHTNSFISPQNSVIEIRLYSCHKILSFDNSGMNRLTCPRKHKYWTVNSNPGSFKAQFLTTHQAPLGEPTVYPPCENSPQPSTQLPIFSHLSPMTFPTFLESPLLFINQGKCGKGKTRPN